jgi:hypothetical protein
VFGGLEGGSRFEDVRVITTLFFGKICCFLEAFVMEIGQLFFYYASSCRKTFLYGWGIILMEMRLNEIT